MCMASAETKLPMNRGYPQPVQVRGILGEKRRGDSGDVRGTWRRKIGLGVGEGAVKDGVDHLLSEIHQVQDWDLVISLPTNFF